VIIHIILCLVMFSVLGVRQGNFGWVEDLLQYKYFTSTSLVTHGHYDDLRQELGFDERLMSISKTWTISSGM